jgi:hypothetical protein
MLQQTPQICKLFCFFLSLYFFIALVFTWPQAETLDLIAANRDCNKARIEVFYWSFSKPGGNMREFDFKTVALISWEGG